MQNQVAAVVGRTVVYANYFVFVFCQILTENVIKAGDNKFFAVVTGNYV
jgi:hypothetical protein